MEDPYISSGLVGGVEDAQGDGVEDDKCRNSRSQGNMSHLLKMLELLIRDGRMLVEAGDCLEASLARLSILFPTTKRDDGIISSYQM